VFIAMSIVPVLFLLDKFIFFLIGQYCDFDFYGCVCF